MPVSEGSVHSLKMNVKKDQSLRSRLHFEAVHFKVSPFSCPKKDPPGMYATYYSWTRRSVVGEV